MSKREKWLTYWQTEAENRGRALTETAEQCVREQEKNSALRKEIKELNWQIKLLSNACEGSRCEREKLARENRQYKYRIAELEKENKDLNEEVDMIAAADNGKVIETMYEGRERYEA